MANLVSNSIVSLCFSQAETNIFGSLEGVKEFEARWIGWAGVNVPDEIGQRALTKALAEKVLHISNLLKFLLSSYLACWVVYVFSSSSNKG